MATETEAKTQPVTPQTLVANQQVERKDRARRELEGEDRYKKVVQPYDAAWNALDDELWSRDALRVAVAIERLVATTKSLDDWDGGQYLSEWLAWLPKSKESQKDAMSQCIALALAGTARTGVCSHDDATALIVLMGENHPCNQVVRLRRANPVVGSNRPKQSPVSEVPVGVDAGAGDTEAENPAGLASLTPSIKKAWASWKLAEANHASRPQDREAYDWLNEHSDEKFIGDLVGYELPAFATWCSYVRKGRAATGESKNQSRAGRVAGSSVVKQSEI